MSSYLPHSSSLPYPDWHSEGNSSSLLEVYSVAGLLHGAYQLALISPTAPRISAFFKSLRMAAVLSALLWYILSREYEFTADPIPGMELADTDRNSRAAIDRALDKVLVSFPPTVTSPSTTSSIHTSKDPASSRAATERTTRRESLRAKLRTLWKEIENHNLLSLASTLHLQTPSLLLGGVGTNLSRSILRTVEGNSVEEIKSAVAAVADVRERTHAKATKEMERPVKAKL